jgi:GNAT superfamily N-acetyltransferase
MGAVNALMENYTIIATGYAGFEDEILRVRNANRSIAQTRQYLDWRYAKQTDAPEPIVFWIRTGTGEAVGMASLIFHPYWVDNKLLHLAVLGDISLDSSLRGKGLGRQLMEYIKKWLGWHMPDTAAYVIPNEAARKSLSAAGWKMSGMLVPYVLPLGHADKLTRAFRNMFPASLIKMAISVIGRIQIRKGYSIQTVNTPDASFNLLWDQISKENLIIGNRSLKTLKWRYAQHPHEKFSFVKLMLNNELAGYLIYAFSQSDKTYYIYDLTARGEKELLCMLALFIMQSDLSTFRLALSDKHPHQKNLWKLGFIKRKDQTAFYEYRPIGFTHMNTINWAITLGDKDV